MRTKNIITFALFTASALFARADSITGFEFTSSSTSWVGGGTTRDITPQDGHTFGISRNYQNGVSFSVTDFRNFPNYDWWYLDFGASDASQLHTGYYMDATRFPFNISYDPAVQSTNGLSFYGDGRGDNQLDGWFEVLEAKYAIDGTPIAFAADFVMYDENNRNWWNQGEIRYESSIPFSNTVPENASYITVACSMLCILGALKVRRMNDEPTTRSRGGK